MGSGATTAAAQLAAGSAAVATFTADRVRLPRAGPRPLGGQPAGKLAGLVSAIAWATGTC
jgi:hypothetical protein